MRTKNQKKKYLQLILVCIFIALAALLFAGLRQIKDANESKHLQLLTERYEFAYNTIYDQYRQLAVTLYSGIMERFAIPELYQGLLTADEKQKKKLRKELLARIGSRYAELVREAKVRQLHFHLRNNESFLRLHRPDKFGDDLSSVRATVNYVNTEHRPISGFEEGRIYNGYRFVFPITAPDGTHLGSMEISFGPNTLTSAMMKQYFVLSNFFIRETTVQQKIYPEEQRENYTQSHQKGYLFDKEVLRGLKEVSRRELQELKPSDQMMAKLYANAHSGKAMSLYDPSINMVITTIPVFNPVSREMVAFFTLRSRSDFFIQEGRHFRAIFCVSLLLLAMIIGTFYQQCSKKNLLEESALQLQKQRQRLIDAQKIANLGHWEIDHLSNHLEWSRQIFTIFELDPDVFLPDIKSFLSRVHPDDRDFVSASFADHINKYHPYDIQHRIVTQGNEEKWVREICSTEYDATGTPLQSLGIIHDITEHHKALSLLQQERDMFMQGPVMTFTWRNSDNWPVEQVSPNVSDLLGYTDKEFLDDSTLFVSLVHPDDLERVVREVKSGSQGQGHAFTHEPYRLRARDGKVVWVQDHTTIVRNRSGAISHYQGYLVDITDTMNLSEELFRHKKRLEMVIQGANLGTWDWNIKSGKVIFNERWAEMLGFTLDEIEPHISTWERLVHPDEEEEITRILTDHLEGRTPVYTAEHRLKHKSGKWIWVLDVGKVFERDAEGNPSRAAGIHMDISRQKDVEQVLLAARKTAETANHAKAVFLSNMSHELRTPLNAILGYAQIFSGDETLTAKQQSGIRTIHQSGEHLLMLINDILDFSKIEADKMELVESEFQLPEFLHDIVNIVKVRSRAKGIGFRYETVGVPPGMIRADELRLRQVLLNLLTNAVKFTFSGHCTLRVHSRLISEGRVLLTFVVEDSGVGIQPEMQEKVFEPFQQSGERLQYSEGSGLGLAISRRLVQLMGGELQLLSPLNESSLRPGEEPGSRFFFTIETAVSGDGVPVLLKRQRITGYDTHGGEGSPKKILVVDDDAINRTVLREILNPLGFVTDEAVRGSDVLAACERFRPDAILMDLLMPEMDGYMATEQLKKHRDFADVPIIAVTAMASEDGGLRQECLEKGFSGFIAKPYVVTDLLGILADLLSITLKTSGSATGVSGKTGRCIPPTQEYLLELLNLIESGDINGVIQKAAEVATIESGKYQDFAREIQDLADDYKLVEIENLIHRYRKV